MDLEQIQEAIREQKLDGWLFFDHHQRDPLAYRILGFAPYGPVTRRWYYLIPAHGQPRGLVHRVEAGVLSQLSGDHIHYSSWTEQADGIRTLLQGCRRVAMQYSPHCAIPYVSLVDAGTVELVRSVGIDVASSAELVQYFEARWSERQLESHLEAGRRVDRIREAAFQLIRQHTRSGNKIEEFEVQQFILEAFRREELITDHGPIVGVNANASDPHYEPSRELSAPIAPGDFVLIDMWAKLKDPGSVYYDITWTGFCGARPSEEMQRVFSIVKGARDAAIRRVEYAVAAHEALRGFEVDDVARGYIETRGFGDFFVHRTGHSIGQEVHGNGANMDNLETHDERRVIPGTCFSIEPGVYLKPFGIRSEVNVYIGERQARVTGEIQQELVII